MATATKKAATKKTAEGLSAYCMKTKSTNAFDGTPVIKNVNGRYICSGVDADGNKMTKIMSGEQAQSAIDAELATLEEEAKPAKKTVAKK